jgi:hypothetical protein
VAYFPLNHLPDIAFESHKKFIKIYCASSTAFTALSRLP